MSDRDVSDHSDDDDDDDAEVALNGGDVPVCNSCGNFGRRTHRDHRCPDHQCAHCGEQGHTKRFCPDVQCPHCNLFGHVNKKDCKYKHCINVEVDWLNILLSVSASHTITELFKASECTVDPNSLRSGGKFRKFADCSQRRPHGFMVRVVGLRSPNTSITKTTTSAQSSPSTGTISCSPRPVATDRTRSTRAQTSTSMLTIKVHTQHPLSCIASY